MGASAEAIDTASNLRRFVGRSFSSDITDDARSAFLCAASPAEGLGAVRRAACIRLIDRSSKCRISNRNSRRLETYLTSPESIRAAVLIATNDDLTKVVVLPNRSRPSPRSGELGGSVQRQSKELSRDCDPLFSASTSLLTPMEQLRRWRFRGALELRYPLNLLGPGSIYRDGEGKC
jgi:hypothetical protein